MPITLELEISGEQKTFVAPSPKARMIRNAIVMTETMDEKHLTTADLDAMTSFVVDVFDKKFTLDDLYDGIRADKYVATLMGVIKDIMGGMSSSSPNVPTAK